MIATSACCSDLATFYPMRKTMTLLDDGIGIWKLLTMSYNQKILIILVLEMAPLVILTCPRILGKRFGDFFFTHIYAQTLGVVLGLSMLVIYPIYILLLIHLIGIEDVLFFMGELR
jgi:hypothetical protein